MWGKKGQQAQLSTDVLKDEETKGPNPERNERNHGQSEMEEGRTIGQKRQFSILKEIKDDQNFKAYLNKFYELKQISATEDEVA